MSKKSSSTKSAAGANSRLVKTAAVGGLLLAMGAGWMAHSVTTANAANKAAASGPTATKAAKAANATQAGQRASMPAAEVDQLTSPVALFPDGLLVQVLVASRYSSDVLAAAAWSKANPGLKGQAAIAAVAARPWDASVKSLCAFPQALQMLAADPAWMRKLGHEFAASPADVMQSTQRLRKMASTAGTLRSGTQQRVVVERETIRIVPVDPKVVYVPTYNPAVVYGAWPYAAWPPVYAPVAVGVVVAAGIGFRSGVVLTTGLWTDVNWSSGNIVMNYSEVNLTSTETTINIREDSTNVNVNSGETAIHEDTLDRTHAESNGAAVPEDRFDHTQAEPNGAAVHEDTLDHAQAEPNEPAVHEDSLDHAHAPAAEAPDNSYDAHTMEQEPEHEQPTYQEHEPEQQPEPEAMPESAPAGGGGGGDGDE